jgi:hypothetical protein
MFLKKILYTVCSANHLAHCKTMADSFMQFNPSYQVIIGLTDKINEQFRVSEFEPYTIIEVGNLSISSFKDMAEKYTVIELNCAMKAFVGKHILTHYQPDLLVYLDSDILVFDSFNLIEKTLLEKDILLTPHINSPYPKDTFLPKEKDTLRSGLYNAGFLAFKPSNNVDAFFNWWMYHLENECYYNFAEGMGVDQLWLNLVPNFFDGVGILLDPGANVAYWNLHERSIDLSGDQYMINNEFPLLFLHISGYSFDQPNMLSRHQNRFDLASLPLLQEMLNEYRQLVKNNGYDRFHAMPCAYAKKINKSTGLMKTINQWIRPLGIKIADL